MRKAWLVALVLCSAAALAQDGQKFSTNLVEKEAAPSYSDLYCSGFLTKESISHQNLIAAGFDAPRQTQYARGNTVFVSGGGLQVGSVYSVLREIRDPNHFEPFKGAKAAVAAAGQPYGQLGQIKVTELRGNIAVAEIVYSCQNMTTGDIVVPFQEHPPVMYRKTMTIDRFPAAEGALKGRIVMAREFDTEVARGQKVYINLGSEKGVKVGDYFRAVRGYDPSELKQIDTLGDHAPVGEDTQKKAGVVTKEVAKTLPVRTLGDMIVLNVTPTSATAMITNSLEDIEVGDTVELEQAPQQ
jgi:hypothetical protein